MTRKQARRPAAILSTWVLVILVGVAIWYGVRHYRMLTRGEIEPVLPVRMQAEDGRAVRRKRVALISGHAGFDTGALCANGLAEVDVNREVTRWTERILRGAGARVTTLEEYDPRLEKVEADVLVSIHADSCLPTRGFKVARWIASPHPARDDRLVACLRARYTARTGLPFDANTITQDMTEYHAFRKVPERTAAAIIETGYLGGDRELLTRRPQVVALGIAEGIGCYFGEGASGK